jgi:hypothetical protein
MRAAVIGAGLAGMRCARLLRDAGVEVTVLEKGRGCGGRLASRRGDGVVFNTGATFVQAHGPSFTAALHEAQEAGRAVPFRAGVADDGLARVTGQPGMSALVRGLAHDITLLTSTRVVGVERNGSGWQLIDEPGALHGPFDWVIVATPAPQAMPLLEPHAAEFAALSEARYEPVWALQLGLDAPSGLPDGTLQPVGGPLFWAARMPVVQAGGFVEAWVLHARPAWTEQRLERAPEAVAGELYDAFCALCGARPPAARLHAHRWRYGLVARELQRDYVAVPGARLAAIGDWCLGNRAEHAWLSGERLAREVLRVG